MTPIPSGSGSSGESITDGTAATIQDYDVIVVGAGFSGISALYRMRKAGLKAHIFEGGSDFGGVWYWNRYPGARVDSETPWYQLNIPEVYKTWNFSQRFPDHVELRKYMAHVDKTLNLRKDTSFNARVNSSKWDAESARWTITTENGITARAQFLILGTGLLHKAHLPEWPGRDKYKGGVHHSGEWLDNIDVKGKKVAIIGAGATSVQIVQEVAKEASQLSVLLRRPSYCLPSRQRTWTEEEQRTWKAYYPAFFDSGRKSATGFPLAAKNIRLQDESLEEREKYFETIWEAGGFHYLLRNYNNVSADKEANKVVYDFWKEKVRERLTDPEKQKIMAPDEMPYYFSTKRTPLEHDYYDMLNRDNVDLVDLNEHPIEGFTENGLQLGNEEGDREYDVVICATGFDSFTGSIVKMGLESKDGVDIKDVWKDGVKTYLGVMVHGFPNTFMVYSPQAPTALANGPTIIECQSDIATEIITSMRLRNAKSIEPTEEAAEKWKFDLNDMVKNTLFPHTNSWWNTSNIPGKKSENQNYILGLQTYETTCRDKMDGWKGFKIDGPQQTADEWKGIDVGGPQQVAVS